jgi:hypothetical protein
MYTKQLKTRLLKRFWFKTKDGFGVGVTAFSLADARFLIEEADLFYNYEVLEIVENIDIQTLDQGHVIPNMKPSSFRGVWFPMI